MNQNQNIEGFNAADASMLSSADMQQFNGLKPSNRTLDMSVASNSRSRRTGEPGPGKGGQKAAPGELGPGKGTHL